MDFGFSEEEERFRQEVRDFLQNEVTEGLIKECDANVGYGPHTWEFLRKLGARGWLVPVLPKELGGIGATPMQQFILNDEVLYYRAIPIGLSGVMITSLLEGYGSEEQKREYIPKLARGEIEFAAGYTEPEAGSDLASLKLSAVEDGKDFILNGQKIFNTGCHYAQYVLLAVRTDPSAPKKHQGISLLIVDMKTPGITLQPLWTMDGERTNAVFYDNVRVPQKNLIGEKNRGWYVLTTALALERNFPTGGVRRVFEDLVAYAKETKRSGEPLIKNPLVRQSLAQLKVEVEVARLLAYRVAWMASKGLIPQWQAPMLKLFVTELMYRLGNAGVQIMGLYGQLEEPSKWVPLRGWIEHLYRHGARRAITAGTNEIQRDIVALRGLGLPR